METATVIEPGILVAPERNEAGSARPGFFSPSCSGRLLLAKVVHELDQFDGGVPILGGGGVKALLLTVREAVEIGLVLGRRVEERLGDRRLQILGKIRIVSIRSVSYTHLTLPTIYS